MLICTSKIIPLEVIFPMLICACENCSNAYLRLRKLFRLLFALRKILPMFLADKVAFVTPSLILPFYVWIRTQRI
jgi:hypothetical protein